MCVCVGGGGGGGGGGGDGLLSSKLQHETSLEHGSLDRNEVLRHHLQHGHLNSTSGARDTVFKVAHETGQKC